MYSSACLCINSMCTTIPGFPHYIQEALKMTDFVLRHGNDLLAIESLKGCEGSIDSMGRILRVGNLVIIDGFTKHHRKVFLFEKCIVFSKTKKVAKTGPTGSDIYDFKQMFKVRVTIIQQEVVIPMTMDNRI